MRDQVGLSGRATLGLDPIAQVQYSVLTPGANESGSAVNVSVDPNWPVWEIAIPGLPVGQTLIRVTTDSRNIDASPFLIWTEDVPRRIPFSKGAAAAIAVGGVSLAALLACVVVRHRQHARKGAWRAGSLPT